MMSGPSGGGRFGHGVHGDSQLAADPAHVVGEDAFVGSGGGYAVKRQPGVVDAETDVGVLPEPGFFRRSEKQGTALGVVVVGGKLPAFLGRHGLQGGVQQFHQSRLVGAHGQQQGFFPYFAVDLKIVQAAAKHMVFHGAAVPQIDVGLSP